MQNKSAIVSVTNDLVTDNRVNKVCKFLYSEGYSVILVGRNLSSSLPISDREYSTKRFSLIFNSGPLFYLEYNLRLFLFLLFKKVDLLVANDLDTLLANYLVNQIKSVRLVYDTHEYFTEVPELNKNPFKKRIWLSLEKWIFPRLKNVITVNDSIAKIYFDKYHVKVNVIRNVAPLLRVNNQKNRSQLNLPEDKFIIVLQGSGINARRGAEEAVEAMRYIDHAILIIIGGGDILQKLKQYASDFQLLDKIYFFPKMPYHEMIQFTINSNLGLAIDHTDVLNHKLALPNKLFDYIQAEIPILSTDLVEVRNLIEKYEIGFVLNGNLTPKNLALKIIEIMEMSKLDYEKLKTNLKNAKLKENWEIEIKKLKSIYDQLN